MAQRMTSEQRISDPEDLPLAVVKAIAEHLGTEPMDLDRPLGDVVDPDALVRLFSGKDGFSGVQGYVAFRYEDCGVVVGADGRIDVYDAMEVPSLFR